MFYYCFLTIKNLKKVLRQLGEDAKMETGIPIDLSNISEEDKTLIESQLHIILTSTYFHSAKQMKRFLEYIVKKTLIGEGTLLKQYTIGVEALGLPDDFDSETNPSVRIMGGRVRSRLRDFYIDTKESKILIEIPKGTYTPKFSYYDGTNTTNNKNYGANQTLKTSSGPSIALVSYTDRNQSKKSNRFLLQTVDSLIEKFSRFLLCKSSVYNPYSDKNDPYIKGKNLNEDYSLSLYVQELANDQYELLCRFAKIGSKQILWSETYQLDNEHPIKNQDNIIRKIIADIVDIHLGRMQLDWARNLLLDKENIPNEFKVLAFYRQYYDTLNLQTFSEAIAECDAALERNPSDIIANIIYADLCRRDFVYSFNQIGASLEKGIKSAEKVTHLQPDSSDGHFVLGQLLFSQGEWDRSKDEFYKAREITSYNSALQYAIGYYFCLMEMWDEGLILVNKSIDTSSAHPSWFHMPKALFLYDQAKFKESLAEARKILAPNIPLGPIMRSVCHAQLGEINKAKIEYKELLNRLPTIETKGRETMYRLFGNKELSEKICDGLNKIV